MSQVRVGFVPVWTTVGKALSQPTGIDGLAAWALRVLDAAIRPHVANATAFTAARWLVVFMAGCKGWQHLSAYGILTNGTFVGRRVTRIGQGHGFRAVSALAMPIRDRTPIRATWKTSRDRGFPGKML